MERVHRRWHCGSSPTVEHTPVQLCAHHQQRTYNMLYGPPWQPLYPSANDCSMRILFILGCMTTRQALSRSPSTKHQANIARFIVAEVAWTGCSTWKAHVCRMSSLPSRDYHSLPHWGHRAQLLDSWGRQHPVNQAILQCSIGIKILVAVEVVLDLRPRSSGQPDGCSASSCFGTCYRRLPPVFRPACTCTRTSFTNGPLKTGVQPVTRT